MQRKQGVGGVESRKTIQVKNKKGKRTKARDSEISVGDCHDDV
jgi:hypothetical protein